MLNFQGADSWMWTKNHTESRVIFWNQQWVGIWVTSHFLRELWCITGAAEFFFHLSWQSQVKVRNHEFLPPQKITLPETNSSQCTCENKPHPKRKVHCLPTIHFQVRKGSVSGCPWNQGSDYLTKQHAKTCFFPTRSVIPPKIKEAILLGKVSLFLRTLTFR